MKISILTGFFVLSLFAARPAIAVWPPETMLQEEANKPSSSRDVNVSKTALPRPRGIVDRLEDDEHRLHNVLRDLEKDSKDLKQSSNTEKHDERQ